MENGRFMGGVAGVMYCRRTRRFLLLQRAAHRDFAPGIWECPAGRLQQGEGFEGALRREMREELGLPVVILDLLGTTHFYRGPHGPEHELIGLAYLCALDSSRSTMAMAAPSRANNRAVARPMPEPPPVISATLPSSCIPLNPPLP